jgi:hypothetical protein
MSITTPKGCFPFFPSSHAEEIVSTSHVKLSELAGLGKSFKRLRHQRQWAAVWDGDLVQTAVIYTEAERTILFFDKKDRCTCRGLGTTYKPLVKVLSDILMEGF